MQLATKYFGEIQVDEKGIIEFSEGLPGFKGAKKYVLLGTEGTDTPFRWLQSIDKPELAFVVADPFLIKKDYAMEIGDDVLEMLEVTEREDVLVLAVVVVPDDISRMTMNLKAPVVINTKGHKGAQIVLDTDIYSVRHYIMEELRKQEVAANASADKKEGAVNCNK